MWLASLPSWALLRCGSASPDPRRGPGYGFLKGFHRIGEEWRHDRGWSGGVRRWHFRSGPLRPRPPSSPPCWPPAAPLRPTPTPARATPSLIPASPRPRSCRSTASTCRAGRVTSTGARSARLAPGSCSSRQRRVATTSTRPSPATGRAPRLRASRWAPTTSSTGAGRHTSRRNGLCSTSPRIPTPFRRCSTWSGTATPPPAPARCRARTRWRRSS